MPTRPPAPLTSTYTSGCSRPTTAAVACRPHASLSLLPAAHANSAAVPGHPAPIHTAVSNVVAAPHVDTLSTPPGWKGAPPGGGDTSSSHTCLANPVTEYPGHAA